MKVLRYILALTAAITVFIAISSCAVSTKSLAVKMVQSEMTRFPEASYLDGLNGKLKWNYTTGLELKAFLDVYQTCGEKNIYKYAENWYDTIIDSAGNIATYKESNYNLDHICPARTLFYLYDRTGKEKYLTAMQSARNQLAGQPRTSEGGFWHKKVYPEQMWLDGLYMAQPFYAEYTSRYEEPSKRDSVYRDIVNNFIVVARHTYDPATGLYRHAWDESKQMFWCDSISGQSQHAWGRAMGWYLMAIVETLDFIPENTEGREALLKILQDAINVLPKYADEESGMWYQVLDCPEREGNYLESTCSAMFSYTLLKGVRKGYLDASLSDYAKQTYNNLVKKFIREYNDGTISITNCCAVAGLGGKEMRSGTFDYYINESIRDNDPKGAGPFIWASLEMERK